MFAIADELVEHGSNECERFGVVEADTAGEAALGEGAELADEELVELGAATVLAVCYCHGNGSRRYLSRRQLHLCEMMTKYEGMPFRRRR